MEPELTEEVMLMLTNGVVARIDGGTVRLVGPDRDDIVSFNVGSCPFEVNTLNFLLQIYTVGYNKGRLIGKEVTKARFREMLGTEL